MQRSIRIAAALFTFWSMTSTAWAELPQAETLVRFVDTKSRVDENSPSTATVASGTVNEPKVLD